MEKDNVYEGEPDERQGDADTKIELFRPRYRKLEPHEVDLHDRIKSKASELADLFAEVETTTRGPLPHPADDVIGNIALNRGANVTLGLRHLEDAVYRAVKALTG